MYREGFWGHRPRAFISKIHINRHTYSFLKGHSNKGKKKQLKYRPTFQPEKATQFSQAGVLLPGKWVLALETRMRQPPCGAHTETETSFLRKKIVFFFSFHYQHGLVVTVCKPARKEK